MTAEWAVARFMSQEGRRDRLQADRPETADKYSGAKIFATLHRARQAGDVAAYLILGDVNPGPRDRDYYPVGLGLIALDRTLTDDRLPQPLTTDYMDYWTDVRKQTHC